MVNLPPVVVSSMFQTIELFRSFGFEENYNRIFTLIWTQYENSRIHKNKDNTTPVLWTRDNWNDLGAQAMANASRFHSPPGDFDSIKIALNKTLHRQLIETTEALQPVAYVRVSIHDILSLLWHGPGLSTYSHLASRLGDEDSVVRLTASQVDVNDIPPATEPDSK